MQAKYQNNFFLYCFFRYFSSNTLLQKENTSLNEKLDQALPQSLKIEDVNDLNEIIDKHRRLMYNFKTKDAEKFANRALSHLPDEQNLLEISALEGHLANMNFLDAHDKFSLIEGNLKLVSLINACKKLASKQKFTNDELINLFRILKDYEKDLYINNLAYKITEFFKCRSERTTLRHTPE